MIGYEFESRKDFMKHVFWINTEHKHVQTKRLRIVLELYSLEKQLESPVTPAIVGTTACTNISSAHFLVFPVSFAT